MPLAGPGAPLIGWLEAVELLRAKRARAETCAGLLKKHGDAAAIDQGARTYGEAKVEVDGVVVRLVVALAQGTKLADPPGLEAKLRRAVAGREAFCGEVRTLVPGLDPGTKDPTVTAALIGATAAVVGPLLVEAVKWALAAEAPAPVRPAVKTIETQLEAARWPAFAAIQPAA